jgi:hypothetical protein
MELPVAVADGWNAGLPSEDWNGCVAFLTPI